MESLSARARGITAGDIRTGAAAIMATGGTAAVMTAITGVDFVAGASKDAAASMAAVSMVRMASMEADGTVEVEGTATVTVDTGKGAELGGGDDGPTAPLPAVFLYQSFDGAVS